MFIFFYFCEIFRMSFLKIFISRAQNGLSMETSSCKIHGYHSSVQHVQGVQEYVQQEQHVHRTVQRGYKENEYDPVTQEDCGNYHDYHYYQLSLFFIIRQETEIHCQMLNIFVKFRFAQLFMTDIKFNLCQTKLQVRLKSFNPNSSD